jgi:hypothetical protein
MTLGSAYRNVLPADHRRALAAAADLLIETTRADGELRAHQGWSADEWIIGGFLPRRSLHRSTPAFAWKCFVCFLTVVWKLGQRKRIRLSCTAKELAAHLLIRQATVLLDLDGKEAAFDDCAELLFEDLDALLLYDNASDGIEILAPPDMGIVNQDFTAWFAPFALPDAPEYPAVHPYVHRVDE